MEVALVPLESGHAPAMHRWMHDPVVAENLGLRSEPSLDKSLAYVEKANSDPTIHARAILADDVHVGNVVLDRIDRTVRTARLHIYVGEASVRGHGVGKRAVSLAVRAAFEELGLQKVWLTVHSGNARAIATYVACGFQVEGVHRREFLLGGRLVDEIYMGVLA